MPNGNDYSPTPTPASCSTPTPSATPPASPWTGSSGHATDTAAGPAAANPPTAPTSTTPSPTTNTDPPSDGISGPFAAGTTGSNSHPDGTSARARTARSP